MAFKGLSDLLEQRQSDLYKHGSARDGKDQTKNRHPYIEKSITSTQFDQSNTSRENFSEAARMELQRIGEFLKSPYGKNWLLNQQNFQSSNTFSQTRLLNPLFITSNVIPYLHFRRPLATPTGTAVEGTNPATAQKIGVAGRLQKSTSSEAVARVATTQNSQLSSLLKVLPPTQLITTIAGVTQLLDNGSIGVNQRPELDINNTRTFESFYSIAMRQGSLNKGVGVGIPKLDQAAAQLRSGKIGAAASSFVAGLGETARNIGAAAGQIIGGRTNPLTTTQRDFTDANNTSLNGYRYFITDSKNAADRYLKDSVDMAGSTPVFSGGFLNRTPYVLKDNATVIDTTSSSIPKTLAKTQSANNLIGVNFQRVAQRGQSMTNVNFASSALGSLTSSKLTKILSAPPNSDEQENPAENKMLYQESSLQTRYDSDARIKYIRDAIAASKSARDADPTIPTLGFRGGIRSYNETNTLNPQNKQHFPRQVNDRYGDNLNLTALLPNTSGKAGLTREFIDANANDALAVLFFYDVVNKVVLPFRAFIEGLTETVSPDFNDGTRYIGRIEKNVVYGGVSREVSFTLHIQAFSEAEFQVIWDKINYLTGLCYPSKYSGGFMVPPLVKLTLGDIYNNQPGYFASLTHTMRDHTWEITPGKQAPFGISVAISFKILEKEQMQTSSTFYNVGRPITTGDVDEKLPPAPTIQPYDVSDILPKGTTEFGPLTDPTRAAGPSIDWIQ
jgi:hypothetical protein